MKKVLSIQYRRAAAALAVALFHATDKLGLGFEPSHTYRIVYWGVPPFALVAGFVIFESRGSISSYRVLEKLGDASYSIYLVHPTIIAALASIVTLRESQAFP